VPVFEGYPIGNKVLRNSRRGADWVGHIYPLPRIALGHFYLPHDPRDRTVHNSDHLDHYLLYQNYAAISLGYRVTRLGIVVDVGEYSLSATDPEDPEAYTFRVPAAKSTVRPAQSHRGPIGTLAHGRGRVHTSLTLRRSLGPVSLPEQLDLESDGDWEPVTCPCCSRPYHMLPHS